MTGVLEHLVVIDLSQDVATSMVGMLLADQGATVIKVEPPGGDPLRASSGWRVRNRGKQSVVLDLSSEGDRLDLMARIVQSDIVLDGPASVLEQVGWTYSDLRSRHPSLILCSISGYAGVDKHSGRPVIESLVAARCGLQWEKRGWPGGSIERTNGIEGFLMDFEVPTEELEGPPREGPLYSVVPWTELAAFFLASVGVGAAIFARERTGEGQHVATSLLHGAMVNGSFTWQRVAKPYHPGYRMWLTDPRVPHGLFRTADDRWVHAWGPGASFPLAMAATVAEDEATALEFARGFPRTGMDPEELLVIREFSPALADAYRTFTAAEWEAMAAENNVSVVDIRSPEEALLSQAFLNDGCVVQVDDPEVGPIRHVGQTIQFSANPTPIIRPAPELDAHQEEFRRSTRNAPQATTVTRPDVAKGSLSRGPLDGVVVLDLGLAVAGPFGVQALADLGADVIKIQRADDQYWTETYMGAVCNRGKRSICIDLKTPDGRAVLLRLVELADVVHSNMRMAAVKGLGLDYETLRAVKPDLIYCHTRGYENGPRLDLPGHDQSGSAISGVAWEEGGLYAGGWPLWPPISLGDTGSGLLSAAAVLSALHHRQRTGIGQEVNTAIAYVHLLNASAAWIGDDGTTVPERPRLDAMHYGLDALHRLYPTGSGWLCLAADHQQHWTTLCQAIGRADLADDPRFATAEKTLENDAELAAILSDALAFDSAARWQELLDHHAIPCEVSSESFSKELFDDAEMIERGLVVKHSHRHFGTIEMQGGGLEFSGTPTLIDRGPCVTGEHTYEILAELGFSQEDIQRFEGNGTAWQLAD